MIFKKFIFILIFGGFSLSAFSTTMSVGVSMQNGINPFTGYKATYSGDGKRCTFRFKQDGIYANLVADSICPDYVTEKRVFMDAQRMIAHMQNISSAQTYAEFVGDDGYGNKVQKAPFDYRCVMMNKIKKSNPHEWQGGRPDIRSGYVFMPIQEGRLVNEWYVLDRFNHNNIQAEIGVWRYGDNGEIIAKDMGRQFTVSILNTFECHAHRIH